MLNNTVTTTDITLTPKAAEKIQHLIEEKGESNSGLRIFVFGGGCAGMQYGMGIESTPNEQDHIFEREGVKLIVDPSSLIYLDGASIDYVEGPHGNGFAIHNPNTPCGGCASSCGGHG